MPIAAHIVRSLTEVLKRERESHSLFLISGMPGVGKTSLVKAVFSDLAYVDLNDIYPRNLARTQPADFFSVYGKRLIVDGIEKAPELTDFLPTDDSSQIVFVGYLPIEKKNLLIEYGGLKCHRVLPFSQREYAQKEPCLWGNEAIALRISYPQPGFFDVIRNGFLPRSDLAQSTSSFYESWLADFFANHVRDVLHAYKDALFFRYMKVLAEHNMQELNHSKYAKEAGISYATAIYWTDFLLDCGVLLEVPSMKLQERRQVKRSKLTYADSGLLTFLLGCSSGEELYAHANYYGVFTGFAAAEIIKNYAGNGVRAPIFFYRDTARKHVELAIESPNGWLPIAFLSQKAPSMKESIRHGDVLIKIGGACQDMLFVSDGTLSVETTSYPIVAASSL